MRNCSIFLACTLMIVGAAAMANGQDNNPGMAPGPQRPHVAVEPGQPGGMDGMGNNWLFNFQRGFEMFVFPPANGAALNDPPMFFPFSLTYTIDFSSDGSVFYGLEGTNDPVWEFGTIDTNTADFTAIATISGDATGDFLTGMAVDPTNETFYVCGAATLYTLDPATAVTTMVNTFSAGFMIEIVFDCDGQMFAHSLSDDSLYSVDKTTADVTLVGGHGQGNSNFAQGMDVDYATNTLYAALFTGAAGNLVGSYGTWDMTTGAWTEIVPTLDIEAVMAIRNPASLCPGGGCPGDLDGDGDTDLADLGILLADFGCTAPGPCPGDLDNDGDTDLADLGILLADFGCTP